MLQDKDIKKIQELKTDYTPSWASTENIFSRFKALKLSEGLSEFKMFKSRGYDFKTILAVLVSMIVSPEKTVHSYLNSATGEESMMGKFQELVCTVAEILGMDIDELLEKMLTNQKAEAMISALLTNFAINDD